MWILVVELGVIALLAVRRAHLRLWQKLLTIAALAGVGVLVVGVKILTAEIVHIGDLGSLAVIAALLAGGIIASLAADRLDPPHPAEEATRRPPRCPRELTPPTPPTAPASGEASNKAAVRT